MNTADLTIEEEYRQFAHEVRKRAKLYPKKHGNWGLVRLSDNRFLEVDTWNRRVNLRRGPIPECNYHVGFRDAELLSSIGIEFGSCHVNDVGAMRDIMRELSR